MEAECTVAKRMTYQHGWAALAVGLCIGSACGNVPSPAIDAMKADAMQADASDIIGEVTTPLLPLLNPPIPEQATGETSMGLVVADSQLAATTGAGAVIAFMNPGGVRAGLDVGPVTVDEVMRVQPFNNTLTTMTLTGSQIEQLLELQFMVPRRILQPSAGFSYTWKVSATTDFVDPATVKLNGNTLLPSGTYRVTVNDFLATGGDSFSVFVSGTDRVSGGSANDALIAWITAHSPVSAPTPGRIITTP